jgi:predicted amidophosphoribosyltransferase
MLGDSPRIAREKQTTRAMIAMYCRDQHGSADDLCGGCRELLDYAYCRLDRCPFGADKTTCAKCPIHCYKPAMRERVREVMRYAGPRMLLRHPMLALRHWLDGLRVAKELPRG